MNQTNSNFNNQLRKVVRSNDVVRGSLERKVEAFGEKGDPLVRGIFGEPVFISDYNDIKKPRIGQNIKWEYTSYGKKDTYNFGKLLEVEKLSYFERFTGWVSDLYHEIRGK